MQSQLTITNETLVAISTKSVVATGKLPHTTEAWEYKDTTLKKWSDWKI